MPESAPLRTDVNGDPRFFITDPPAPPDKSVENWYAVADSESGIIAYCLDESHAEFLVEGLNTFRLNPSYHTPTHLMSDIEHPRVCPNCFRIYSDLSETELANFDEHCPSDDCPGHLKKIRRLASELIRVLDYINPPSND